MTFPTGEGQSDTRAPILSDGKANPSSLAGSAYATITAKEIVGLARNPPSVPKGKGRWFIPSDYMAADARSHAAQRERGRFRWITLDVDSGSPSLEAVGAALVAVLGNVRRIIYATRSAVPSTLKWRALIPVAEPIAGADYFDTQTAFFDALGEAGIDADRALARPGQLVYLPNRGEHYAHSIERDAPVLKLIQSHPLIERRDRDKASRDEAEAEANRRAAKRLAERLQASPAGNDISPVEAFNATHAIPDLLTRYGYRQAGSSADWRSPYQTGASFATRATSEHWVSLSASDAAAAIGAVSRNGAIYGDAFDLFAHFDHANDFAAAVRSYGVELCDPAPPPDHSPARTVPDTEKASPFVTFPPPATQTGPGGIGWSDPDPKFLRSDLPPAPVLSLGDVLGRGAADWVARAAEASSAPADYVLATLFAATGATVGNARWVAPWQGWQEPPILWTMCIGLPSAGKSPGIEAALAPLRRAEKPLRRAADAEMEEYRRLETLAKLAKETWEATAKAAIKKGNVAPPIPKDAEAGAPPHIPRLIISDATVERVAVIASVQPKGAFQVRDELAGWLLGIEARNGGADRAFWLEAFGGRGFTVERMGRAPLTVERLSVGVVGGIQPDRLSQLLTKATDDGLLARFIPIWPDRIPMRRPERWASDEVADEAFARLLALEMSSDENGELRPWFVQFDEPARVLMQEWRLRTAELEREAAGLLLSFIGKLSGMSARLALILACLDHAFDGTPMPDKIGTDHMGRATRFLERYALPMARRAYADASVPEVERKARRLLDTLRREGLRTFTTREVMRMDRAGLGTAADLKPVLEALAEGDCIRFVSPGTSATQGRPSKSFEVNPVAMGAAA